MKLLIVEDDPGLVKVLRMAVTENGYEAVAEGDGVIALERAQEEAFDLILLDVMLPGLDGFTICRRLREAMVRTPILIMTARDAVKDKVDGLDAGADDYIVKPFPLAELLARVRALLRRAQAAPTLLRVGDLVLNPATREARRDDKRIYLSATEFSLLEFLMRNAGRVLNRSAIMNHVWEYDFGGNDNVLEVYISYLRGKIDKGSKKPLIHTVRGVGYVLEDRGETRS
ncbi:MAG: response regulator transcription factor [Capsulimonadales bacterium]|nr:response regulator transcription factor [Capsulimonadales bacterium]